MLENIKKELINNPDKLEKVLEHFGYSHIVVRTKYIQFGRDNESSNKSIVIKLENNDYLYVKDYPRNINCEFFSYIIKQRHIEFIDVLNVVKNALGITDYYDFFNSNTIFGGFYDNIKKKNINAIRTYKSDVLNQYEKYGNLRFLKDNISIEAQRFFDIRYDIESQSIVIPIYDQFGSIMGAKARINYKVEDGELKYYYLIPCAMSQTLYAYSQNYQYLVDNDIYIFESEKSPMQCYSYGVRNCIALGSSSISIKQCKMIMELRPRRVIFMHDEGLDYEIIKRNMIMLKSYAKLLEIEIGYWDTTKDKSIPHKASASDLGESKLLEILNSQILMLGDEKYQEEL